jgi:hypothetical protein
MKREQIIKELDGVGDWTSDKCWEQHPIAAEAQRAIKTLEANHEWYSKPPRSSGRKEGHMAKKTKPPPFAKKGDKKPDDKKMPKKKK